jgi:hypothetical protein
MFPIKSQPSPLSKYYTKDSASADLKRICEAIAFIQRDVSAWNEANKVGADILMQT